MSSPPAGAPAFLPPPHGSAFPHCSSVSLAPPPLCFPAEEGASVQHHHHRLYTQPHQQLKPQNIPIDVHNRHRSLAVTIGFIPQSLRVPTGGKCRNHAPWPPLTSRSPLAEPCNPPPHPSMRRTPARYKARQPQWLLYYPPCAANVEMPLTSSSTKQARIEERREYTKGQTCMTYPRGPRSNVIPAMSYGTVAATAI
jgi:hypothetical protein